MRPYSPGGALNTFATAGKAWRPPRPSAHRLQLGLPGYLIPFAPLAFVPQRQQRPSEPLSPPVFLMISTHFTAPPSAPLTSISLKLDSFGRNSSVEPKGFHTRLTKPPTNALSPVIPNNVCTVRVTAAAGTNLACASSEDRSTRFRASSPLTAVYNPKAFIPHAASLRQAFAHCGRFSTAATRRCLGSVSVPVTRVVLSHPLPI